MRNNVGEWDEKKRGAFNYITNRQSVQDYWIERLKEVKGSKGGNLLTIGMRGIHDGSMQGVKTMKEKFDALQLVIDDQQKLIGKYLGNPAKQTQVFIPYKEVLDIYNMGLKVPDYVTLMWCDDNYGYITRLSDSTEYSCQGGGGVYYHLSYWGRPHDFLWLTTMRPGTRLQRDAHGLRPQRAEDVDCQRPRPEGGWLRPRALPRHGMGHRLRERWHHQRPLSPVALPTVRPPSRQTALPRHA